MAEVFVKHTLNPRKAVKFNLNLREYALKDREGESVWVLEVGTTAANSDGEVIKPRFIDYVSEASIEDEIEAAISEMCSTIDWSEFDEDRYAPTVTEFSPQGPGARIKEPVKFTIKDKHPSSGIDLTDMKITLNNGEVDFDITSEVEIVGDPRELTFKWYAPKLTIRE